MLKRILIVAAVITVSASFPAFAGEWRQDQGGWWYDFGDTTYAKDGWQWVDGKCYCLLNTTTPDGYTVDASGAWIIDGVVQVQDNGSGSQVNHGEEVYQLGSITLIKPLDFSFEIMEETFWALSNQDDSILLAIGGAETELSDGILTDEQLNQLYDHVMLQDGVWDARENVELTSGRWRAYLYKAETTKNGYSEKRYIRIKNNHLEMIILGSIDPNMDKDGFLNQCIR